MSIYSVYILIKENEMKDQEKRLQSLAEYKAKYLKAHLSLPAMKRLVEDLNKLDEISND